MHDACGKALTTPDRDLVFAILHIERRHQGCSQGSGLGFYIGRRGQVDQAPPALRMLQPGHARRPPQRGGIRIRRRIGRASASAGSPFTVSIIRSR